MKKNISALFTALIVIAITAALIFAVQTTSGSDNSSVSAGAITSTADNSNNINSDQQSNTESQAESSVPTQTENNDTVISFLACPDNVIHPSTYCDAIVRAAKKKGVTPDFSNLSTADYDFAPIYEDVKEAIEKADLSYINVETLIGGNENKISGFPMFNTPEKAGETLYELGFDIYNVAHNHMLDSGSDKYLKNCYKFFNDKGVTVIGYYEDEAATDDIVIVEKNGIKIALLAYTYSTNGLTLQPGAKTYIPLFNEALIRKQVAIAKQKADVVIVSAHWGIEDTYNPSSDQITYAQLFADLGVDVVIGMHPHVIQPMKWVENASGHKTLLIYSLGNFVSGMQDGFNLLGGMLSFDIVRDGKTKEVSIKNPLFTPTVTHYIDPGKRAIANDTGYRDFKIYYLKDYTEELALQHGVKKWDLTHKYTLVGGAYSKKNLVNTVKKYIPAEFLPDEFK